jgi:hypothetical protein
MMSSFLGALAALTCVATLAAAPASASSPAGGCPAPYFLTPISDIPAEGEPGAIAIDEKGNGNGYVCLLPFTNPEHPGAPFNGIDNRVQRR